MGQAEEVKAAENAWNVVIADARRWQVEMTFLIEWMRQDDQAGRAGTGSLTLLPLHMPAVPFPVGVLPFPTLVDLSLLPGTPRSPDPVRPFRRAADSLLPLHAICGSTGAVFGVLRETSLCGTKVLQREKRLFLPGF
jgi:hypothetical protein